MSWEVFKAKGGAPTFPRATITRMGNLTINRSAGAILSGLETLPRSIWIELSVDFEAGLVGIKESSAEGSYHLKLNQTNYVCGVGPFLRWAGIPPDRARRYRLFEVGPQLCFRISDFADVSRFPNGDPRQTRAVRR